MASEANARVRRWIPVLGIVVAFALVFSAYAEIGEFEGATEMTKAVALMGGELGLVGCFMWKYERMKRTGAERMAEVYENDST